MKIKTLKSYQEQAVASGLNVFLWAKSQYDALPAGAAAAENQKVTAHTGTILLEAPTGSGKTLSLKRAMVLQEGTEETEKQ